MIETGHGVKDGDTTEETSSLTVITCITKQAKASVWNSDRFMTTDQSDYNKGN